MWGIMELERVQQSYEIILELIWGKEMITPVFAPPRSGPERHAAALKEQFV